MVPLTRPADAGHPLPLGEGSVRTVHTLFDWISSIYFQDPNGIVIEFAAMEREFNPALADRRDHVPATPADAELYRHEGLAMRARIMAEHPWQGNLSLFNCHFSFVI
jgi:hypothetical protein